MPTHQDETLPQRYAREHQDYLKLCGSMTAEQVTDLQLQLNNSLAREQALHQRLTAADERADFLLDVARSLTIQAHASIGNTENHEDCIRDLIALTPGLCEHSYHHFGDYPRRRCNLCNKLEPTEGGGDEAV